MKRKFILPAILLLACLFSAGAQNLNPTVSVTNTYKGKLKESSKQQPRMTVPDSLLRFDYNFDYSVNDTRYGGISDFRPYTINMRPDAKVIDDRIFYLRAGAGYLFKPELNLIFSPTMRGRTRINLYNDFKGYYGDYKLLGLHRRSGAKNDISHYSGRFYEGYDFSNNIGADFSLSLDKMDMKMHVSDDFFAVKDTLNRRFYNGVNFSASVKSRNDALRYIYYEGGVYFRYGRDNSARYKDFLNEILYGVNVKIGPVLNEKNRIIVDLDLDAARYDKLFYASATHFAMSAKYEWMGERSYLGVGGGYALSLSPKGSYDSGTFPLLPYPAIEARFNILPYALIAFADIDGGEYINTYHDFVKSNHHFDYSFAGPDASGLLRISRKNIGFAAGLKGQIRSYFNYKLSASYDVLGNSPLTRVFVLKDGAGEHNSAALLYADYNLFHTDLELGFVNEAFNVFGRMRYQKSNIDKNVFFTLPEWTGELRFLYNWHKRINAGLRTEFASMREGTAFYVKKDSGEHLSSVPMSVKEYLDLGLYTDYAYSSKITFWIQCGNLLNQEIQRNILYSEPGRSLTAGICINL